MGQGAGQRKQETKSAGQYAGTCPLCGAVRVDDQLGLEATHDCYGWASGDRCGACYVCKLTATLRDARRVLAPHGTLWLNLGDSYASKARGSDEGWDKSRLTNPGTAQKMQAASLLRDGQRHRGKQAGLKEKDLAGIPWSMAMSLRADGWWLRADAVWCKPNPMPESTEDRPVKAHEYVFLLARSRRYWYDRVAVLEPLAASTISDGRLGRPGPAKGDATPYGQEVAKAAGLGHGPRGSAEGRNMRSVWEEAQALEEHDQAAWLAGVFLDAMREGRDRVAGTAWRIATEKFPGAHFATFPTRLAERAILAGCPAEVCRTCGKPRERIVETDLVRGQSGNTRPSTAGEADQGQRRARDGHIPGMIRVDETIGWSDCGHDDYRPGIVLDPFFGSGTTAVAARRLGRHAVGIELSPEYADLAAERVARWWRAPAPPADPDGDQLALTLA